MLLLKLGKSLSILICLLTCRGCWYKQGRNQSTNTLQTCRIA
jgi:hypothetical protein